MSEYIRQYLSTFLLPPFTIQDVHVMPVEFISPVMLDDIYSYHKALRVLHCPDSPQIPKTSVENHLKGCCHIIRAKTTQKPPPSAAITHPAADLSVQSDAWWSLGTVPLATPRADLGCNTKQQAPNIESEPEPVSLPIHTRVMKRLSTYGVVSPLRERRMG